MSRDLIRQLKQLKRDEVSIREEWQTQSRAILLSQIKNTLPETSTANTLEKMWSGLSIFLPQTVVYNVVRPVALVMVVILVATTAYSGTVKASYETLPGDWLYSAKRVTEKTQIVVASIMGDKNSETKLHNEFAKRRANETKQILKIGNPEMVKQATANVADLKDELNSVNSKLEETKSDTSKINADVVKDVKQNTEQIKNFLQEVKNNLSISSTTADKALSQEVNDTKDLSKDVSIKAVEVMVAKHLGGDVAISKDEVNQAVSSTIQNVIADAGESKQNVDGAKTLMDAAKIEVKDLSGSAGKQNDLGRAATKEISDKVNSVANQTVAAVLKSEVASAEVGKKITEAKELLVNDDLVKAMDKVKEANQASKEVEKISDNTLEKTKDVMPIVQIYSDTVTGGTSFTDVPTTTVIITATNTINR